MKIVCIFLTAKIFLGSQTYHATVLNEEGPSMAFQIIGVDVMFDHQV